MKKLDSALRVYQQRLSDAAGDLLRMITLTHEGFLKHKRSFLQEAEKAGRRVHDFGPTFDEQVIKEQDKEGAKLLVSLAGHLERIGECLDGIIKTVHAKIKDGTLFSDKAVSELNQIFDATAELIRDMRDIVLTLNPVLMEHVSTSGDRISKIASEFATLHEERLVTGVCQPKHSAMYLEIVDNLRCCVWHLREMVSKVEE